MMNEIQKSKTYCGLCREKVTVSQISKHKCFDKSSNNFMIMGDKAIHPEKVKQTLEETLIDVVKEHPQIWNRIKFPTANNVTERYKLWSEITDIMNAGNSNDYTVSFLKTKWKNLYDTYRAYLIRDKRMSDQGKKCKPWKYLERMSFCKNAVDTGKRRINYLHSIKKESADADKTDDSNDVDDDDDDEFNDTVDADDADIEMLESNGVDKESDSINKIIQSLNAPIPAPQLVLPAPPSLPEKDEIACFCLMMDKKLRKLPPKTADTVMFKIHELVFKFEHEKETEESSAS